MSEPRFERPPRTLDPDGRERRIGFEIEFAGLPLDEAAGEVVELFGGRTVEEGPHRLRVVETRLGDFDVTIDADVLQEGRYLDRLRELEVLDDPTEIEEPLERIVGWVAGLVVPFEITMPPLPLSRLTEAERLREALARREARGTGSRWRYALGLHINAEISDPGVESILRHLQAFLALYEQLLQSSRIDFARSLLPFISPFPSAYVHKVLDPGYRPTLEELASDYVADNPSRNRPLDLLPLLAELLGVEALAEVEDHHLVSPRPAWHYRLPNSRVDEPGWTIAEEWNRWVLVERLAADPDALARACVASRPGEGIDLGELGDLWRELKSRGREALDRFRGDADDADG